MPDPWYDHVVQEIRKAQQDRLLEITSQLLYLEEIELVPAVIADALLDEISNQNSYNKLID